MTIKEVQRGQILGSELSISALAVKMGLDRKTIARYKKGFEAKRTRAVSAKKAARRAQLKVLKARGGRKAGPSELLRTLREKGHKCGRMTLWRDLNESGYVARVRPKVTNNDPVKNEKRFKFAQDKAVRKAARKIIFSDECYLTDNEYGPRHDWVEAKKREKGARGRTAAARPPSCRVFRKRAVVKTLVWAAVGYGYKGPLIILDKYVNAETYCSEIVPHVPKAMRESGATLFMQDGAKAHTAKVSMAKLAGLGVKVIANWPAHSPHLNPIERIWGLLHYRLSTLPNKTKEELIASIKKV